MRLLKVTLLPLLLVACVCASVVLADYMYPYICMELPLETNDCDAIATARCANLEDGEPCDDCHRGSDQLPQYVCIIDETASGSCSITIPNEYDCSDGDWGYCDGMGNCDAEFWGEAWCYITSCGFP